MTTVDRLKSWPGYLKASPDDLAAIGIIALNYSQLENALLNLFVATGINHQVLLARFYKMRNDARRDELTELIRKTRLPKELKDRVGHFLECFKICATNRNAVMHSSSGGEYIDARRGERGVILSKFSTKGEKLYCSGRLGDLRKVADEIREVELFGHGLAINIRMFWDHHSKGKEADFHRLLLFQKSPLPTSLSWDTNHVVPIGTPKPRSPTKVIRLTVGRAPKA